MRVLSLFSGIGGLELGLEWAGMEVVGQCEFNRYCRKVLEKHWPGMPRWIDVREVTGENVQERCGHIDLVCGGFPCQDISVAGKGAGLGGERSGLWWEMWRVIKEVRPAWVLAENVPALRTRGADDVITALEGLGYTCWPVVVGAWAVGAPHKRDRVWIVAHSNGNAIRKQRQRSGRDRAKEAVFGQSCPDVAHAHSGREEVGWQAGRMGRQRESAEAAGHGERVGNWLTEPNVGRVGNGFPARMDRLRCLGNAVVPQVAEQIGRAILRVIPICHHPKLWSMYQEDRRSD